MQIVLTTMNTRLITLQYYCNTHKTDIPNLILLVNVTDRHAEVRLEDWA
jgi:hypothetical protein